MQAIVKNDFATFKTLLDPATQQDGVKCGGTWAIVRIMMGVGGLKEEDLRIDSITVNADLTLAMLTTSHREKGEWKKERKHWMP